MHAKIYGYEYKWFLGTRKSHLKSENKLNDLNKESFCVHGL